MNRQQPMTTSASEEFELSQAEPDYDNAEHWSCKVTYSQGQNQAHEKLLSMQATIMEEEMKSLTGKAF